MTARQSLRSLCWMEERYFGGKTDAGLILVVLLLGSHLFQTLRCREQHDAHLDCLSDVCLLPEPCCLAAV